MTYRFAVILALLAQATPQPTPKRIGPFTVLDGGGKIVAVDNGTIQLTIADGDMPVGPCDLGKLVRAARAYMDGIPISWSEPGFLTIKDGDAPGQWEKNGKLLRALQAELAHCEPKSKETK